MNYTVWCCWWWWFCVGSFGMKVSFIMYWLVLIMIGLHESLINIFLLFGYVFDICLPYTAFQCFFFVFFYASHFSAYMYQVIIFFCFVFIFVLNFYSLNLCIIFTGCVFVVISVLLFPLFDSSHRKIMFNHINFETWIKM